MNKKSAYVIAALGLIGFFFLLGGLHITPLSLSTQGQSILNAYNTYRQTGYAPISTNAPVPVPDFTCRGIAQCTPNTNTNPANINPDRTDYPSSVIQASKNLNNQQPVDTSAMNQPMIIIGVLVIFILIITIAVKRNEGQSGVAY